MIEFLTRYKNYLPMFRYYASYGGADRVSREVFRLQDGGVIVAAGIAMIGRDGTPPWLTVEEVQSSEPMGVMIRDMAQRMCDMGNRHGAPRLATGGTDVIVEGLGGAIQRRLCYGFTRSRGDRKPHRLT